MVIRYCKILTNKFVYFFIGSIINYNANYSKFKNNMI